MGDDAGVDAGPSCTELLYDGQGITRWPEPAMLIDDATTETDRV